MSKQEKNIFLFKPLIGFFLVFSILSISYFLFDNSGEELALSDTTPLFKSRKIFSHLRSQDNEVSYTIKFRESMNRNNIHRVYFYIGVPKGINQEQLMAIAQKIVREAIFYEICHSINIDFGSFGYVDFAPYGNWAKAGEVPIGNYKDYRFKYHFSSLSTTE